MSHLVTARLPERLATALADVLMEGEHHLPVIGAGAFEQEPPDWRFEAWFAEAPDGGEFTATMRRFLGAAFDGVRFEHRQVDDTDWVAKSLEDLPPVRAGRFVVHGAHDRSKVRPNEIAIPAEASAAFGTGHHATTLGCLLEIDRWLKPRLAAPERLRRDRVAVLDIGTGTGVLAIAAAKALRGRGIAGDLDPEAVRIARENVAEAGLRGRIQVVAAGGTRHPAIEGGGPYPLVAANILMGPLIALAPAIAKAVAPGGTLILSGLLNWQARAVGGAYLSRGFRVERRRRIGDWATLVFRKASAQR